MCLNIKICKCLSQIEQIRVFSTHLKLCIAGLNILARGVSPTLESDVYTRQIQRSLRKIIQDIKPSAGSMLCRFNAVAAS